MTLSAVPTAEKYAHVPTASSATARRSTVAMVHFFFMHKPPFSLPGVILRCAQGFSSAPEGAPGLFLRDSLFQSARGQRQYRRPRPD